MKTSPHPTQSYLPAANGLDSILGLVLHGAAEEEGQLPNIEEGVLVGGAHIHAVQLHHTPSD